MKKNQTLMSLFSINFKQTKAMVTIEQPEVKLYFVI